MGLKMNIAKTTVMVVDNTPTNVNNVQVEHVEGYVYLGQHYSLRKRTRTKRYNEESWQAGQHTPNTGISSKVLKQPCHLAEETGVQLLCAASYASTETWCRDMDTDQTSTEQTCGRTHHNGKKYAQHHIYR